jgi:hypothetical protein
MCSIHGLSRAHARSWGYTGLVDTLAYLVPPELRSAAAPRPAGPPAVEAGGSRARLRAM